MKIVFAASEAAPFIKTGGLGDVAQALPNVLSKYPGEEVLLFLPYYGAIKWNPDIKVEKVSEFQMDMAWRSQYVGLMKLKSRKKKLRIYFIDNEYYFNREGTYGYPDDGERYAFFSKAILACLVNIGEKPDIIHCNDWQTALVPIFLHALFQDELGNAKTVFTIHNIEYQGWTHPYFLGNVLGISEEYVNVLQYKNSLNFMKGAILTCDALTTVSQTYAGEICDPYYAHGLSPVICDHSFKLSGIVNGIDTGVFSSETDKSIVQNYTVDTVTEGKAACKKALQEQLGLKVREDVPIIGMVSRLVGHKGLDILCAAIDELMDWDVQIVILGTGDAEYENRLHFTASRHTDKFSLNLCYNAELSSRIYAAADMYLMPSKSEPCGLSQLIAMHYGTVPIVNETGGLKDTVIPFVAGTGEGLGFTFQSFNKDDMLGALRRALEIYGGDKELWHKVVTNDMNADVSWEKPAEEYLSLYKSLIG